MAARSTKRSGLSTLDELKATQAFAADMAGEVLPLMKPLAAEKVRETVERFLVSLGRPELAAEWRRSAG